MSRDRVPVGDGADRSEPPPAPWIPAMLVAVAVVLVVAFVFFRRDDPGDSASSSDDRTASEPADPGGGDGGGNGTDAGAPEPKPESTWPEEIKWKPAITGERDQGLDRLPAEVPAGLYLWSDFQGWFVWVVDPAGKAAGRGRITTNSEFGSAELVEGSTGAFERRDDVLEFDFTGIGERVAGFRFNPGFFTNRVTIELDGDDLPVFLGHDAVPFDAPHVLEKTVR